MESLALLAAVVMLSVWGVAGASLLLSFLGFRRVGLALGVLSAAAGVWLLCVLPHVPLLGLLSLACGAVAVRRGFRKR
jgi:hypothetical protein